LTIYLTILHSFLSVSSRRCGACAAPSAEHARPQASNTIQVSKEFGFIDHRIIHYNEYGLPYLKYLFLDAMTVSKTRLYTYINADIFVNINILQAAEAYYQYRKDGWLLCSRVFVTKSIIHASNVTQRMDIDELARKHSVQRLRVARAIV
ncbi:hypothetical protein WA171_001619, partial [Blastocystis sp. BT1]